MRRFLLFLVSLLALAALAVATVPWWLGGALRAGGGRYGLAFERYERLGYGRFALEGVRIALPSARWQAKAARVEAPNPVLWLAGRWRGQPGLARVSGWEVEVTPDPSAPKPDRPALGWTELHQRLRERLRPILARLPAIEGNDGAVRWPGHALHFREVTWRDERLTARGSWDERPEEIAAEAAYVGAEGILRVKAALTGRAWRADAEVTPQAIRGQVFWQENRAALSADFSPDGWWPREARVVGKEWKLPATEARLGDAYRELGGDFALEWVGRNFTAEVDLTAAPLNEKAPPLQTRLRAKGDPQQVAIEQLTMRAPWGTADLTAPVIVDRQGRLQSARSEFALELDLERQPWVAATGKLRGRVQVTAGDDRVPDVAFQLSGQSIAWDAFTVAGVDLAGRLTWPRLLMERLDLDLADQGMVTLGGEMDFRRRLVAGGHFDARLAGAALARWLPPKIGFAVIEGDGTFEGNYPALRHTGRVRVTELRVPVVKPVALAAEWQGEGLTLAEVRLDATRGTVRIQAEGAVDAGEATVRHARLARGETELWRTAAPARVTWQPVLGGEVELTGPGAKLAARIAGATGELDARLEQPPLDWVAELFDAALPAALRVRSLQANGRWSEGAGANFSLGAEVDYAIRDQRVISASLAARTEGDAVRIERLDFSDGTRSLVRGSGRLPVALQPGRQPWLRVDPEAPVQFEAATEPYREFWEQVAALTGARVINPAGRLSLAGSLARPQGTLNLTAESASFDEAKTGVAWPAVENLAVRASADGGGLRLEEFAFRVDGQPARITGRLPLDRDAWWRIARNPASLDWREGDLRLEIDNARLAPFARYLPRFLAPQGHLSADLTLRPGGEMTGQLEINDAASRPLGSLGSVQNIEALVEFAGRRAELRQIRASIGGEPLELAGWLELPAAGQPRVNVSLKGNNVPVARQPGLVVRSDLDLKVMTEGDRPPRVTGALKLRDSLYVANLRSLVPGERRAGPTRAAPYFSIEPAPLNGWQLDVRVGGQRFLRVRTPLFRGLVSAQFQLRGTLGDPVAVGEARVDEGTVLFPFAGFVVDQGRIALTPEQPREPELHVSGTALRYGYDLRMDLTGTPSRPNLAFSSRPSLTSEEILLLVMAGEPPSTTTRLASSEGASQQRFAQLGAYLGRNLFTTFGGDPGAAERLTITTGERLSRQGQETLEVEYELGRRWSLVGEYDEFDDYNVGLKYKILRRQQSADEPPSRH